jgi:tRNA dimethylallyltransferase
MIVSIFGPTAVGKSRLAVAVAREIDGEIVSADSMQVYRGLSVLTDQPGPELLDSVPHHLVGTIPLDEEYSAGRFVAEAGAAIDEIASREKTPILCGGTGLYIRALLGGFSFAGRSGTGKRGKWEALIETGGLDEAYRELQILDPEAAEHVDRGNPRRLVRALEAAESAGHSIAHETDRLWSPRSDYRVHSFGVERDRQSLYRLIESRVDSMLGSGAIEEVSEALEGAVSRTAAQSIGFQEIAACLSGRLTIEEAASSIKRRSRHYAKRQLTWMRKMPDIARIDLTGGDIDKAAGEIIKGIRGQG